MFFLTAKISLLQKIEWSFGAKSWFQGDDEWWKGVLQVRIEWPHFTMDDIASDQNAIRAIAHLISKDGVDWISFQDEVWRH